MLPLWIWTNLGQASQSMENSLSRSENIHKCIFFSLAMLATTCLCKVVSIESNQNCSCMMQWEQSVCNLFTRLRMPESKNESAKNHNLKQQQQWVAKLHREMPRKNPRVQIALQRNKFDEKAQSENWSLVFACFPAHNWANDNGNDNDDHLKCQRHSLDDKNSLLNSAKRVQVQTKCLKASWLFGSHEWIVSVPLLKHHDCMKMEEPSLP